MKMVQKKISLIHKKDSNRVIEELKNKTYIKEITEQL